MATLPNEALHQEALADFVLIRTADIRLGDRLRPVDRVWAEALGQLMLRDGQDTAIQVCRLPGRNEWELVAGGHRFVGAVSADIEFMRAEIVSANRDDRRMREVRENLWRSDLDPIDRAANIAEAVAIIKRRAGIDPDASGRAASANVRWQKRLDEEADDATDTMAIAYGWSDEVGTQIGLSARTVRRDLMLYRLLPPSLVERLREARHPVASNATQLRTLAKLDEHAQAKVVELLLVPGASLNYGQPKTVGDAIAHPLGPKPAKPKPAADHKRFATVLGTMQRMGAAELAGLFQSPQFRALTPKGMRIADGAEPRPEAQFSAQHVQYREETLAAIDQMRDLVEGLLEDDVIRDGRARDLRRASGDLQLARFAVSANGFDMSGGAA